MHDYVFVLWGYRFEEFVATVFITELREAGLPVKLVGLAPGHINGVHGLALVPDFRLTKALSLAAKINCLIIPTPSLIISQLKNDPRLMELFCLARANMARFVVGQVNGIASGDMEIFPKSPEHLLVYPGHEDLILFARDLAGTLSTAS